jgi:signal transduction histidine kinase
MVSQQKMEQDLSERNLLIERNKHEKEIQAIRTEEERKRMAFEHDQVLSCVFSLLMPHIWLICILRVEI